jgi:hypothetical protein
LQRSLRGAIEQLGTNDYLYVSFSVEPDDTAERLVQYSTDNEFNWTFAPSTPEFLQSMIDQFGQSIAAPPVSPHFIITPDGKVHEFGAGPHSVEDVLAEFQSVVG